MTVRAAEPELDLEPFRRELTGYCYRMLGSGFEAEDAVQETMVRAWRHAEGFEGRSSPILGLSDRHQRGHRHAAPGAAAGHAHGDGSGVTAG